MLDRRRAHDPPVDRDHRISGRGLSGRRRALLPAEPRARVRACARLAQVVACDIHPLEQYARAAIPRARVQRRRRSSANAGRGTGSRWASPRWSELACRRSRRPAGSATATRRAWPTSLPGSTDHTMRGAGPSIWRRTRPLVPASTPSALPICMRSNARDRKTSRTRRTAAESGRYRAGSVCNVMRNTGISSMPSPRRILQRQTVARVGLGQRFFELDTARLGTATSATGRRSACLPAGCGPSLP